MEISLSAKASAIVCPSHVHDLCHTHSRQQVKLARPPSSRNQDRHPWLPKAKRATRKYLIEIVLRRGTNFLDPSRFRQRTIHFFRDRRELNRCSDLERLLLRQPK